MKKDFFRGEILRCNEQKTTKRTKKKRTKGKENQRREKEVEKRQKDCDEGKEDQKLSFHESTIQRVKEEKNQEK